MGTGAVITEDQIRAFADDGYVVVPNVVALDRVCAALRAANYKIGQRYEACEPDQWKEFVSDSVFLDLLIDTAAIACVTQLVGRPVELLGSPQLALRFPVALGETPRKAGSHLDGLARGSDEVRSFTLLAGVLLSDTQEPDSGNTVVWPGTHRRVAEWFRTKGGTVTDIAEAGHAMGVIAWESANPTPVCGNAGDLLLAHYLLLHGAGQNASPHIRYEVFFRLRAEGHLEHQTQARSDVLFEFEPIRRLLGEGANT